jgi:Domain of unknown function (DUF6259)
MKFLLTALLLIFCGLITIGGELFNGKRASNKIASTVLTSNFFKVYPDLFQFELWKDGDYKQKTIIKGKWSDLDKSGNAVYSNAKVKVSIVKVNDKEFEWRINITPNKTYGVFYVKFPIIAVPKTSDPTERLIVPRQYGYALKRPSTRKDYFDGSLPRLKKAIWFGPYGGFRQSMQMIIYETAKRCFMLWTRDPDGYSKDFVVTESEAKGIFANKSMLFYIYHFPINTGQAGVSWESPYPTVTSEFKDDYYTAAKRYRKWAIKQPWCSKGTIMERLKKGDLPKWFANNTLWAIGINENNLPMLKELSGTFPFTEIGVFLTQWQRWPFDTNVPQFHPPKNEEGFKKLMAAQKNNRLHFTPYMNMHLIDADYKWALDKFRNARAKALPDNAMATDNAECRDYVERWGRMKLANGTVRKRYMNIACRMSKQWHNYFNDMVNKNLAHYGADGQYYDQVAVLPYPCWDKTHGHTLGFGPYLLQGGRELLKRARKDNPGKLITGEHIHEFYIGVLDDTYTVHPFNFRKDTTVLPVFPLVYQDYISQHQWNIPPVTLKDPVDFASALAFSIHLGHKPGAFKYIETTIDLLKSENSRSLNYLKQIEVALRVSKSIYGELLETPSIIGSPMHDVKLWQNTKKFRKMTVPAVTGSTWRLPESGQIAFLLTNAGMKPASIKLKSKRLKEKVTLKDLRTKEIIIWKSNATIVLPPLSAKIVTIIKKKNKRNPKDDYTK